MPEVIFNPELKQLDTFKGADGKVVFRADEPQAHAKQACEIVRGLVDKRGIDQGAVPCVHRVLNRFRYWDLRRGKAGASHKCVLLCSTEWRLADAAEVAAQHRQWEQARASAAANALNEEKIQTETKKSVEKALTQNPKKEAKS